MPIIVFVTGLRDDFSRHRVGLLRRHSWPEELDRRQLRLENDVVNLLDLGSRAANDEGPGDVAAIAIEHRAPIEKHRLIVLQQGLSRQMVWKRAVRSRGDDRLKADGLCTAR